MHKFIAVIYWQKPLWFPEFCAAKKHATKRSIFWAGPEASSRQQSMSQHVEGSRHTSAGWGPPLLQLDPRHRHNEHHWSLERRASVGHPPSLFSLLHWRQKNHTSPVNPFVYQ